MSDDSLMQATFSDDALEECAPTERAPGRPTPGLPARGVALSVLWWLEGEENRTEDRSAS